MDQENAEQIMLGVDPDEAEIPRASAHQKEATREIREAVSNEIAEILDLSYYHLGNDGLQAILPQLEYDHLLCTKQLDVSYNSLTDAGLHLLINSLAQLGSPVEVLNISGNQITDKTTGLLSECIRNGRCRRLGEVVLEDCRNVSAEGRRVLRIAQMKVH